MSKSKQVTLFLLSALLTVFFLLSSINAADEQEKEKEWIEIDLLVNVVGDVNEADPNFMTIPDKSVIKEAIKETKKIYEKWRIRLVEPPNTDGYGAVSDSNDSVDKDERDDLRLIGEDEIEDSNKDGIKIFVVLNIHYVDPCEPNGPPQSVAGLAIHSDDILPVAIVEISSDTNEMGSTIAHEMGHILTLGKDVNDPNNLMYYQTGGVAEDLNSTDVNEIRSGARKIGRISGVPDELGGSSSSPAAEKRRVIGRGKVLDDFYDANWAPSAIDPCDPNYLYADIEKALLLCDNPGESGGTTDIYIRLGGVYPSVDFDAEYAADIYNYDGNDYSLDGSILLFVERDAGNLTTHAEYEDYSGGGPIMLSEPTIYMITEAVYPDYPVVQNGLKVTVPTEFFNMSLSLTEPTLAAVHGCTSDSRVANPGCDSSDSFTFGLLLPYKKQGISFIGPGAAGTHGFGVVGHGFEDSSEVGIELDAEQIGSSAVTEDGRFTFFAEPGFDLSVGEHSVIAMGLDANSFANNVYATGQFLYDPNGSTDDLLGDLTGDYKVNFDDLAVLASQWLKEKQI